MIHLFMKRGRRGALLFCMPAMALAFVLLNTVGSTQTPEQSENSAGVQDYEEVFSAGDSNGVVYIDWLSPKAADESSCTSWFLGAYKFVSAYGSNGVMAGESLCVDLDRRDNILSNDIYYAINCSAGDNSALYITLRDTNGLVLAESDNLLTAGNVVRYVIPAEAGIQSTNAVLLLQLPISQYPSAAIIQTVGGHNMAATNDSETVVIREGLLFINGSDLWFSDGQSNGTYPNGASLSNYYDWGSNSAGSLTNSPGGEGGGGGDEGDVEEDGADEKGKIIYVDQAIGNDTFTGRSPNVAAAKKGPKKTVGGGLGIAGTNDTIIIRSGNYNENLNIQGKDVKVFIEGKVRL